MAEVIFAGVAKRFGEATVIKGFDLQIRDQEFMVLVGPSGCGKSTLLRMLAGLEDVSEGTIAIGGRVVNRVPPKDRDIAMVFQNYALYPHMTVRENLEFGLKMRKTPRAAREQLVSETAAILGITHLLDRRPRQLSGGQRQRVAVGRAIVRKPAVFLFDEPLSNLDAKLRVQMRGELTRLQHQLGTTTLYVTHDQVEAMTMGQRIAIMNQGELMQVGTPQEVYERPANVFVASFIGVPPMNLVTGSVSEAGDSIELAHVRLPVPAAFRRSTGERGGGPIIVGIRPESLAAVTAGSGVPGARVTVTVELVEPLGHEVVVYGRAGADLIVARLPPHVVPRTGDTLELAVDADAVHLFDAASGHRLKGQGGPGVP